jgi:ankyrin repeat protein
MTSFFRRIVEALSDAADDALAAAGGLATNAAAKDEHHRLLWLLKQDAGSDIDPLAGGSGGVAGSDGRLEEYGTADELLAARPTAARFRDPESNAGPLFWAALYGPLSVVERLESLGADPLSRLSGSILIWTSPMKTLNLGGTSLMMAAFGGNADIVRHLLDRGVAADAIAGEPPDSHARSRSDRGSAGEESSERGDTALLMAARGRGTAEVVRLLVGAGGDPNMSDYLGFTPLGEAAARGAGDVVRALLEVGADPTTPSGGESVLELAGNASDPSAMRALLEAVSDRILTMGDVTAALEGAAIPHDVVPRSTIAQRDIDLVRYMSVYGEVLDELHNTVPNAPTYYVWACRSEAAIAAIDLEDTLEDMDIGPRRFATEGEVKAVLGIVAGGITPFATVNDTSGRFAFNTSRLSGDRAIAVEAFDEHDVIVLQPGDAGRASDAFAAAMGPSSHP